MYTESNIIRHAPSIFTSSVHGHQARFMGLTIYITR